MTKTKKIIIGVIAISLIGGGYVWRAKSNKPKNTYTTAEVIKGDLKQTVSATGDVVPKEQYDLSFKSGGFVSFIAEIGSKVVVDEKIASLDKASLQLQVQQAQKDVEYQQRIYANMRRNETTFEKEQRAAQKALVEKALLAKSLATQNLNDADIYAPVNGIIVQKNQQVGEYANFGSTVISVATKDVTIESKIPESDIAKITMGQKASITFDAFSDEEVFSGGITEIDPAATVIQDVVYYKIKVSLNSEDDRIKPGMSVNLDIATAERNGAIIVPQRAIKAEGSRKYVEVLNSLDNTTKQVNVETGMEGDEGMVEIKSGLKGGEKVVTFVATK